MFVLIHRSFVLRRKTQDATKVMSFRNCFRDKSGLAIIIYGTIARPHSRSPEPHLNEAVKGGGGGLQLLTFLAVIPCSHYGGATVSPVSINSLEDEGFISGTHRHRRRRRSLRRKTFLI